METVYHRQTANGLLGDDPFVVKARYTMDSDHLFQIVGKADLSSHGLEFCHMDDRLSLKFPAFSTSLQLYTTEVGLMW